MDSNGLIKYYYSQDVFVLLGNHSAHRPTALVTLDQLAKYFLICLSPTTSFTTSFPITRTLHFFCKLLKCILFLQAS